MPLKPNAKLERIFTVRNRWACLVVYMLAVFLTSCVYYGWQHMQFVLVLSGKFEDKCPPGSERGPDEGRDDYLCEEQADAIDIAYTVASSFEFGGALAAGLLYDYTGPALTAFIGEAIHFTAWIIILSTNNSGALYCGFALLGLSVNIVAIAAMILMMRFPRYPLLMESLNLSAQTTTAFIMPTIYILLINHETWTWNDIMAVYLPIAACVVIGYFALLPWRQDQVNPAIDEILARRPHYKSLTYYITRPQYLGFIVWYTLMIMQGSMLNVKIDTVASKEVSEYVGWIFWLQAPLGVLFGFINEKINTLRICFLLTGMTLLAYLLTIINYVIRRNYLDDESHNLEDFEADWTNEIWFYIGSTFYVVSNAYIYTTKYTWVTDTFPSRHFGTIVGLVGLSAGVLQTINTALVSCDDLIMLISYFCLGFVQIPILVWLWWTNVKKGIDFKAPTSWSEMSEGSSISSSISRSDVVSALKSADVLEESRSSSPSSKSSSDEESDALKSH